MNSLVWILAGALILISVWLSQLVSQFQVGRPASEETLRRELKEAAPHAFKARETAPRRRRRG